MSPGRAIAAIAAVGALAACGSVDPLLVDGQGRSWQDLPAAPYTVALAPFAQPVATPDRDVPFALTSAELQQRIVAGMADLRAASAVLAVDSPAPALARSAHQADLLLVPRVRESAAVGPREVGGHYWWSGLAWLTTWFGGLLIDDYTYDAKMIVDFDVYNTADQLRIGSFAAASDATDLSFLQRNSLLSFSTLQSLVLPPFWTSDGTASSSTALSDVICRRLAARATGFLKQDLVRAEADYLGQVLIDTPINLATLSGDRVVVKGQVIAGAEISGLTLWLNDLDQPVYEHQHGSAAAQRRGNRYVELFEHAVVGLREGDNVIAIELAIGGRPTSRTLAVRRPPQ